MVIIYQDYRDEPEDVFAPLPPELACRLYHLEMGDFSKDTDFYQQIIPTSADILEMGCGTGRVTCQLAREKERSITGIDISLPMLHMAKQNMLTNCRYICMDMIYTSFRTTFDIILISYNTLNLIPSKKQLARCLGNCRRLLRDDGLLIVQLFIPDKKTILHPGRSFQFQIMDRPQGGKVIKEIRKKYHSASQTMTIEERFRIRPMQDGENNRDYHSIYTIYTPSYKQWLMHFSKANFTPEKIYGDYKFTPYSEKRSTCLLSSLRKTEKKQSS